MESGFPTDSPCSSMCLTRRAVRTLASGRASVWKILLEKNLKCQKHRLNCHRECACEQFRSNKCGKQFDNVQRTILKWTLTDWTINDDDDHDAFKIRLHPIKRWITPITESHLSESQMGFRKVKKPETPPFNYEEYENDQFNKNFRLITDHTSCMRTSRSANLCSNSETAFTEFRGKNTFSGIRYEPSWVALCPPWLPRWTSFVKNSTWCWTSSNLA